MGKSKRSATELRATAFHEAGHAVVAWRVGRPLRYLTIAQSDDTLGHVRYYPQPSLVGAEIKDLSPTMRARCECSILTSLAGPQAEKIGTGRYSRVGAATDHVCAADLADLLCGSERSARAYLRWLTIRTEELLAEPPTWEAIERVAAALLATERLSSSDLAGLVFSPS